MTEQTARKVPSIRFKGFEGEWITKKVLEICGETYGGGTPKTSDERFWTGNIPWIQSSDLKDLKLYDVKVRKWINSLAISNSATKLIPDNSIAVVTRVGVGKIALIEFSYTTSQDFLSLSKLNINQLFAVVALSILLQSKLHETQGTSIKGLTKEELLGYTFSVPTTEYEQTKIGTYFKNLDQVIELHQQKHKRLITLKKAMLQKMFPKEGATSPEIRFKGFDECWKKKSLEAVCEIIGGGTPSTAVPDYWGGDIDWYSPTEIGSKVYASGSTKKITKLGFEKSSARMLPADKTILFTSRAGIGDMAILKKSGCTNQGFQSLVLLDDADTYFIYSMGYLIKDYALRHASGSTFLEISSKQLRKMKILLPSEKEQQKIGNYFRKLDTLISQQATQLKKLKQIKAACLEKMFV